MSFLHPNLGKAANRLPLAVSVLLLRARCESPKYCAEDIFFSNLDTAIAVLRDVGSAMQNMPYLQIIAGVMVTIIRVKDVSF